MESIISEIAQHKLLWGFVIGFLMGTLLHVVLVSPAPQIVPLLLLLPKTQSYTKMNTLKKGGHYEQSYAVFSRMVDKVKLLAFSALALVFCITAIGILSVI